MSVPGQAVSQLHSSTAISLNQNLGAQFDSRSELQRQANFQEVFRRLDRLAVDRQGASPESIQDEFNSICRDSRVLETPSQAQNAQTRSALYGYLSTKYEMAGGGQLPAGNNLVLQYAGAAQPQAFSSAREMAQDHGGNVGTWLLEGIGSVFSWLGDLENWKNLGSHVADFATNMWEKVTTSLTNAWNAVTATLTDPAKLAQFFQDWATGKLYLNMATAALGVIKNVLVAVVDTIGVKDLVLALGALLMGDPAKAFEHLKLAGAKLGEFTGITNLYNFVVMTAQAVATGNKDLFYQGLKELGMGVLKVASLVALGGTANVVVQGIRGVAMSLMYREVGQQAVTLCFKEVAKETFTMIAKQVSREEFEIAGMKAAQNVGKTFEKSLIKEVESVAGRGTMSQSGTYADDVLLKIDARLSDPKVLSRMESQVAKSAEEEGYKACKGLIETAQERAQVPVVKVFGKELGKRSLRDGEELVTIAKENVFEKLKKMSQSELEEMVRASNPAMKADEVTKTAKAMRHISKEEWHFGRLDPDARKLAKEAFSDELTEQMLAGGLRDGFKQSWAAESERIRKLFGEKGIKLSDEFMERFEAVAKENFESGVRRACRELAEELFKKKDDSLAPDIKKHDESKKKKLVEAGRQEAKKPEDGTGIPDEGYTIDAAQFGKGNEAQKKAHTLEDVLTEIDKDKERQRRGTPTAPVTASGGVQSGAEATRQHVGTNV